MCRSRNPAIPSGAMNESSAHTPGQRNRAGTIALALAIALLAGLHPLPGHAQTLRPGGLPAKSRPAPPPPSSSYAPERVRTALMAIHGFTREELDGTSSQVPQILMDFVDNPKEAMLVQRQAIKALKLYPSDSAFLFLQRHLAGAPQGLAVLLLQSLSPYAATRSAELVPVLQTQLQSPDVVVRHAAVSLAAHAGGVVSVRGLLSTHLASEPDRSVRSAIETALSAN